MDIDLNLQRNSQWSLFIGWFLGIVLTALIMFVQLDRVLKPSWPPTFSNDADYIAVPLGLTLCGAILPGFGSAIGGALLGVMAYFLTPNQASEIEPNWRYTLIVSTAIFGGIVGGMTSLILPFNASCWRLFLYGL